MVRVNTRREINAVILRINSEVLDALNKATGRTIWHISETDRLKLCRLWVWSQRYSVSLEYMLLVLIPYFTRGVEKRTGKKSKGLGISISVLTGNVAEDILKKAIDKDWPEGDHLSLYREREKDRITALIEPTPEFRVKVKKSLQYKTLAAEAEAYSKSINKAIKRSSTIENMLKKIPFRGNAFR